MKEHGILMKPEMIRAYRAGQKTQTRRIGNRYSKWAVGDVLWFREAWRTSKSLDHLKPSEMMEGSPIQYEADDTICYHGRYRQAMFMPRWACRHTAKIISIREERLQDISAQDAMDEGIGHMYQYIEPWPAGDAVRRFRELWQDINGKKPGRSWSENPLVTRIQFERYQI